jgi:hypothetical protein
MPGQTFCSPGNSYRDLASGRRGPGLHARCGHGRRSRRSGASRRREHDGRGTGHQIGSERLIMPNTCLGWHTARRLACSGRGSSVPEKRTIHPWVEPTDEFVAADHPPRLPGMGSSGREVRGAQMPRFNRALVRITITRSRGAVHDPSPRPSRFPADGSAAYLPRRVGQLHPLDGSVAFPEIDPSSVSSCAERAASRFRVRARRTGAGFRAAQ